MKIILVTALALILLNYTLQANKVSEKKAAETALAFFTAQSDKLDCKISDIYTESFNNNPALYVFSFSPSGFVAVAADDIIQPILGYSVTGNFDKNKISPQLKSWLEQYSEGIYKEITKENGQKTVNCDWEKILSGNYKSAKYIVLPMCSTLWEQGCWYNDLCPYDTLGPCDHAVTGCVATAMAQVMKYWNYPAKGQGSHTYTSYWYGNLTADFGNTTYDWPSMTDAVSSANPAIATLMHHCGVSVNMDYYATTSGSNNYYALTALPAYFKYSENIQFVYRSNYSDSLWIELMKSEMDAGRPVLYQGGITGIPAGHAWVCDGYDSNDFLHFNWGDGNTGYWEIGNWIWNDYNEAVIKIMPVVSCDIAMKTFISPVSATFASPASIKVHIANYDTLPRTNIPVSYIVDGGSAVDEIISTPLAALSDTIYEFINPYDFSQNPGHVYDVKVYSSLACDGYKNNDTISVSVENVACVSPPYSTGFEPSENINGWLMVDVTGDGNKWNIGIGGNFQPACVYYNGGASQADDWLFSKCLQLETNKMYKLTFYYNAMGQFWPQKLGVYFGNQQNAAGMTTQLHSDTNIVNSVYQKAEIYFTVPSSDSYYIGWHCFTDANMYNIVLDDINITEQISPDAGLVSTSLPYESCDLQQENVEVIIKNYCSTVLNNFQISYSLNGASAVSEIVTTPIPVGGSINYIFGTPVDLSANGQYNIKIYTSLSGDTLNNNDTLSVDVINHTSIIPAYTMEFEPAEDFSGWKIFNSNEDNFSWSVLSSGGKTQPYCIRYDYNYNCNLAADDWFVSPCIDLDASQSYRLGFWYKAESNQWAEKLKVFVGNGQAVGALTTELIDIPNIVNTNYQYAEVVFDVPTNGLYYLGWYCYSDVCMFNLYVDDINLDIFVSDDESKLQSDFKVFPNPFNSELIIENNPDSDLEVVYSIYTPEGKLLMQQVSAEDRIVISTKDFTSGILILKISGDSETVVRKIIKQ